MQSSPQPSEAMTAAPRSPGRLLTAAFVVLMLALAALFALLGTWQLERLGDKEALLAAVATRSSAAPVPFPPAQSWPQLDPAAEEYRPVRLAGRYRPEATVLVFTGLSDPQGSFGGPGYWVMTPFRLEEGGTVFVNRGFVPEDRAAEFADGQGAAAGPQVLEGIMRRSETVGSFTPAATSGSRREWLRNVERLAAQVDPGLAPVAPLFVDLPAGAANSLPQGGETVMTFSNRHLEYAVTWFGFALITPVMLVAWLWRQRRRGAAPSKDALAEIPRNN